MSLNHETKLLLALYQVEGVMKLIEGNDYEQYMYMPLNKVKYELRRQLSNLDNKIDTPQNSV